MCLFSIANEAVTGYSANHSAEDISCFFVKYIAVLIVMIVMRKGRVGPRVLAGLTCEINIVHVVYLLEGALLE